METNFNKIRDALIMKMNKAQQAKIDAVKIIDDCKAELNDMLFDGADENGTTNYELGKGHSLKCVNKLSYKLKSYEANVGLNEAVDLMLDKLPKGVGDLVVEWTPKLNNKNYEALSEENQKIVDTVLGIKSAKTAITFVKPKEKK